MTTEIIEADIVKWLAGNQWLFQNAYLPKYHAVFCDPPYFLGSIVKRFGGKNAAPAKHGKDGAFVRASKGFMGKTWDGFEDVWAYQEWVSEWATLLLSAVYPGALGLFFGGTRTYHRLAAGLEDAGWDVVDSIAYMYGSGLPKSHSVDDEDWEGFGTSIKPSYEPCLVARAPRLKYTFADLAVQFGSGLFNIDAGRIESTDAQLAEKYESVVNAPPRGNTVYGKNTRPRSEGNVEPHPEGRFPCNMILGDEIDLGESAKYFYTAKASTWEREAGLEDFETKPFGASNQAQAEIKRGKSLDDATFGIGAIKQRRNTHPTLKPISLTEYLSRLILPPTLSTPRRLLVPFAGSGSEMIGAQLAGWDEVTGIEREHEYTTIATARLKWWSGFKSYEQARKTKEVEAPTELILPNGLVLKQMEMSI